MVTPIPSDPPDGDDEPQPDLESLRKLLVGPERSDLEQLRGELSELRKQLEEARVSAEDVSQVLPKAVAKRAAEDEQLSNALAPTIERSIQRSVKRDPGVIADAIFPVIGPAIRKSIREALAGVVENINKTVEHSFTPKGLRWRLEAKRSGRPFAEIVLKHSLVYRVEQVFLIHRETALLLAHAYAPGQTANNADVVSSMLGAIQDFVSDSFQDEAGLAQVEFGDHLLEIARSPSAVLACVVRGMAPVALRTQLQETLEAIHGELGLELREFQGDDSPFTAALPAMEELLVEQLAQNQRKKPKQKSKSSGHTRWWFALCAALLAIVYIVWNGREQKRIEAWEAALHSLEETPGIVVTSARRDGGSYMLRGLRDPLASEIGALLVAAGLPAANTDWSFGPYYSLESSLIEIRVRTAVDIPATVGLNVIEGLVVLSGHAPDGWIEPARARIESLPGVSALDDSALVDSPSNGD